MCPVCNGVQRGDMGFEKRRGRGIVEGRKANGEDDAWSQTKGQEEKCGADADAGTSCGCQKIKAAVVWTCAKKRGGFGNK